MKKTLVDINVWLALLVAEHEYHADVRAWYARLAAGDAGMCRLAQLGVIRLLGTPAVMRGHVVPAAQAWDLVQDVLADERAEFVAEPPDLDVVLPTLFRDRTPTPKLVGDAYLAAIALASSRRLVTYDSGFSQFPGLDVQLLS